MGEKKTYSTILVLGEEMNVENKIREKFDIQGEESPYSFIGDRTDIARMFAYLGYTTGAEIGVNKGQYSLCLCSLIPNLKLYCVDPWLPYKLPRQKFMWMVTAEKMEEAYEEAKACLAPYNAELMRMTSEYASKSIPDDSLDFVYIDGIHDYENVMRDITLWNPKVRTGGILSGHDYAILGMPRGGRLYRYGVVEAVTAFVKEHNIKSYFITAKKCDRWDLWSWFWVKE
jgi:hypothetical protein